MQPLPQSAIDQLFVEARTHSAFEPRDVPDELLRRLYELVWVAPTSANCRPMRPVFVKGPAAKARLRPCLAPGNVDKAMSAPVAAIVAMDLQFYEHAPRLFPHVDTRPWCVGKPAATEAAATLNAALEGGYLVTAARARGLDGGPLGGFDRQRVDAEFLSGTSRRSLFLCDLGYGARAKLHPRLPRLGFDEACEIV